jgi:hypothetical protein
MPDAMSRSTARIRPFRTPVRGHAFAPRPPGPHAALPDDEVVELRREPANPADPLAVAVYAVGAVGAPWRLGYLDRSVAARIAPRMDAGMTFAGALDGWVGEPDGRWQRPLLLVLPEQERGTAPGGDAAGSGSEARSAGLWGRPPGSRRTVVRSRTHTT